jgi:pyrroloquinoline quinone (PQQ) biosynthesis protein C
MESVANLINSRDEEASIIQEWEETLGARVRETMAAPEMERYFSVKMTADRARVALLQLSLFVQCRRDCWANLIANCDALPVRQRLMEHEYDELIEDEYSSKGHYDLLVRQGELVALTGDDFAKARPLRTSMATFYGWKWITREGPWQDGLIAMMATEWVNDDRRLIGQGGGLSRRDGLRWIKDFGYQWDQMPNFAAHAVADEKHGDLFLSLLPRYIDDQNRALEAADDALELFKLYHLGVAEAMEKLA